MRIGTRSETIVSSTTPLMSGSCLPSHGRDRKVHSQAIDSRVVVLPAPRVGENFVGFLQARRTSPEQRVPGSGPGGRMLVGEFYAVPTDIPRHAKDCVVIGREEVQDRAQVQAA